MYANLSLTFGNLEEAAPPVFQKHDAWEGELSMTRGGRMKLRALVFSLGLALMVTGCNHQAPGQVNASPSGDQSGNVAWQQYQDPLEQAFTLDVPTGWTVKGGMFRLGYSDHRVMVDMTSPDGKTNIRIGDLAIPTYFLPNQFHHEGQVYDLGAQAQGRVARYRTGQEFAKSYGEGRFARICPNLTAQQSTLAPIQHLDTPQGADRASEGDITYACADRTGYVYAQTALMKGLWQATALVSYLAPPDQVAETREIILHSNKSFQLSPAWIEKQNKMDSDALVYQRLRQQQRWTTFNAQMREFEARMQGMRNQVNDFERGQAQRQQQFQQMDNIISGITPSVDPYGNHVSAFNGPHNHNWYNPGTGKTVSSDLSPGPGWVLLTPEN